MAEAGAGDGRETGREGLAPGAWGLLAALFVAATLWLLGPALDGEFLADDLFYVADNPYVHGLTLENVKALLDPWGVPTVQTLNYAPVHLLLHAAQWELAGPDTRLYHVTNAVLHGLTAALLVLLLLRAGLPRAAAVFGGAVFLVHPANLETVAWIFQLKTIVALALSLGALRLHPGRPAWAATLFALAMLTKVTAIAMLPAVAVQAWVRAAADPPAAPRWGWIGVWVAIVALVAVPEMAAFARQDDPRILVHADPAVHLRTVFAVAGRYLVMAFTGLGVSAFHAPAPAASWLDPWWLGGLVGLALLGARTARALWRRQEEAVWWVMAAAGFLPVSQIFPFLFAVGDRYLYPILPGLLGGVLLAGRPAAGRLRRALAARGREALLAPAAAIVALAVLASFAVRFHARAPVYRTGLGAMIESARNYPDGMQAHLLAAQAAARRGDAEAAAAGFERAVDRGFSDLQVLAEHPAFAGVRGAPAFRAMLERLAGLEIARLSGHPRPTQAELLSLALAFEVRGEREEARRVLERALEAPGRLESEVRRRRAALGPRPGRERAPAAREPGGAPPS